MTRFLTAAAFAICGSTAHAQTAPCVMNDAEVFPEVEAAKTQFLKSDHEAFIDTLRVSMGDNADALVRPMEQLSIVFPNGFDRCQTIVQRVDRGGMVQDVTVFEDDNSPFPIALYLLAFPAGDRMVIGFMNFNTEMGEVLDELK